MNLLNKILRWFGFKYKCDLCGKKFRTKMNAIYHILRDHQKDALKAGKVLYGENKQKKV